MRAIRIVEGRVAVLDRVDVDTDQIIPKQFLKRIDRTGYGEFAFFDWRYDEDGAERPEFELNRPEFAGARVLLVGADGALGDVVVPSVETGEALIEAVEGVERSEWDADTVGATKIGAAHRRRMAGPLARR